MCGIAGIISPNIKGKEKIIGDMVAKIFHRGPDDDGFYVDENVALGMRRLSIIDLPTGKQPIWSEDGKRVIFFNGEIYNYKELREELIKKGCVFKTNSDTEVVLHMYGAYGEEMLPRLRGMFVFCIYNVETKKIFVARDFFGIKPLYYLKQNNKITAFSSEIKSLLTIPGFKAEVNHNAVINFLSFQYNPLMETFFKNVFKLPPAHYLTVDLNDDKTAIKRYWSFSFNQDSNPNEQETTRQIEETIRDSVRHHMIADVPVGAFLSGGIDSSIIATLMQEIRGDKKIKTFTVGFDVLSEGKDAKQTSDFLGTDHMEIIIGSTEYFEALPKAAYHFDEPVADPSAIGLYFIAREARKHVKVVLSGEGADELFGGYNIYLAPFAKQKLVWVPKSIVGMFVNLPFHFFGKNYLRRVNMKLENWYIGNATVFNQNEIKKLLKLDIKKFNQEIENDFILKELYEQVSGFSDSTKMQHIDINTWLVGDILAKADKMTMAHSLELRVPFLDTKVAELAKTLPDHFKWRKGVTKYLLREAFSKVIPESTRNRRKLGFPIPIRKWLNNDRQDMYNLILKNEYINSHMDVIYIQDLIHSHISKNIDNSRKIYALLMLTLWYNTYIK